ncbi:hypothetical protein [Streptomyces collinus]|uniref:hypothetical protein n=1 Tax=Streptomyces collinus TaxID=42684 RepID=UPI0036EBE13A
MAAGLDLHLRGAVRAGQPGTPRTSGRTSGAPLPALPKAVHASLYRPAGLRRSLERRAVREALGAPRGELAGAGLLRRFPPGRTRTGGGPCGTRAPGTRCPPPRTACPPGTGSCWWPWTSTGRCPCSRPTSPARRA